MQNNLLDFMARSCHYAQEHIDDIQAWGFDPDIRENRFQCVSYQMACFFAQNTVNGNSGVESDVVLAQLVEHPAKSIVDWNVILDRIAIELGGWK